MKAYIFLFMYCNACFNCFAQTNWIKSEELIIKNPPFKACHASSIVQLSHNELMVAFFAGSGESNKDVCIWITKRKNNTWQKPSVIADGVINNGTRFACWNPVLFKSTSGKLFLFYKVGANPRAWWGMMKTSIDNGNSWSAGEKLPKEILGPIKNKPVQLEDGTILCPSSIETDKNCKVRMEKYDELNNTWKTLYVDSVNTWNIIQPTILKYKHNKLQILCRSNQNNIVTAWSYDNGNKWSKFSKLKLLNPNSGIDAVTLKNGLQLLVYNPTGIGKDWFNNRNKLFVATSEDGINWKDISVLENDINTSNNEFSYPAIIQADGGTVHITYTYKRKNIKHITLKQSK